MDALLPKPAPIGMLDRSVYKQPGKFGDPSERNRYKKADAECLWTLRKSSGYFGETASTCGCKASTSSGSSSVTSEKYDFFLSGRWKMSQGSSSMFQVWRKLMSGNRSETVRLDLERVVTWR